MHYSLSLVRVHPLLSRDPLANSTKTGELSSPKQRGTLSELFTPRSRSAPLSSSQAPLGHGLASPPPGHGQISKCKRPVNGNAIWGGVGWVGWGSPSLSRGVVRQWTGCHQLRQTRHFGKIVGAILLCGIFGEPFVFMHHVHGACDVQAPCTSCKGIM